MKVMLIEDDSTMISLLSMLLEMEGYQIVQMPGPDPEQILSTLEREKPDLLLMDVNLSCLSGLELLRQIRKNPTFQKTRILMSSGLDYQKECAEAGADSFILKPYMPEDLIHQMRQLLKPAE